MLYCVFTPKISKILSLIKVSKSLQIFRVGFNIEVSSTMIHVIKTSHFYITFVISGDKSSTPLLVITS